MTKEEKLNPESMTTGIIKTMKLGGCSPKHTSTRFIGHCYIFFTGLVVLLLILKWYFTPPESVIYMLEDCIMLCGFLQISAKYFTSVNSAKILSEMLDSLYKDFWTLDTLLPEDKAKALTRYKIANFLSRMYGTVVMIAISLFCLQATIKGNKGLIMDIWIPYKHILKISPYYEIFCLFQAFLLHSSAYFSVIPLDRLFILLTCYVCEQFKMIRRNILKISGDKSTAENFDLVRKCVIHNNLILKFLSNFDSIYSRLFLPTVFTNFILSTITMYGFIVEETLNRKLTNIFIYVSVTGQLFAYCLAGQLIQDEGLEVGEAAYQCNWYEIDCDGNKIKIALSMIIMRSQRRIQLTVGGLMVLSMQSFATVLRATFSFLTFIVNVRS